MYTDTYVFSHSAEQQHHTRFLGSDEAASIEFSLRLAIHEHTTTLKTGRSINENNDYCKTNSV